MSKASVTNGVGHVIAHGPAHYPPGPDIDHSSQVQKPRLGRYIRDVRNPKVVWSSSGELSAYQIRCCQTFGILPGSGHFTAAVNPLDAGLAHEPGYPLATHSHPFGC